MQPNNNSENGESNDFSNEQLPHIIKTPDQWATGNEPMTAAQKSYLKTLSDETGEPFDDHLTKAEASKKIEELQQKSGRNSGIEKNINSQVNTGEPE
ncbi:MAG: DUF3072 domain-containing protein [Chitinophagaceae bacterium]|nr:DUF3072 domain-containing protein [Chitinophagaceae bacterium]HEV8081839.1 DUF3072 domain-containing protein [Chitinophagaceae bacterium]